MDYVLMIWQENGTPIMTEHMNKRFKEVVAAIKEFLNK